LISSALVAREGGPVLMMNDTVSRTTPTTPLIQLRMQNDRFRDEISAHRRLLQPAKHTDRLDTIAQFPLLVALPFAPAHFSGAVPSHSADVRSLL
jgi:hypothetical protein